MIFIYQYDYFDRERNGRLADMNSITDNITRWNSMVEWVRANCISKSEYSIIVDWHCKILFYDEGLATAFKLRWE